MTIKNGIENLLEAISLPKSKEEKFEKLKKSIAPSVEYWKTLKQKDSRFYIDEGGTFFTELAYLKQDLTFRLNIYFNIYDESAPSHRKDNNFYYDIDFRDTDKTNPLYLKFQNIVDTFELNSFGNKKAEPLKKFKVFSNMMNNTLSRLFNSPQ